jgi:hypothetical protein
MSVEIGRALTDSTDELKRALAHSIDGIIELLADCDLSTALS